MFSPFHLFITLSLPLLGLSCAPFVDSTFFSLFSVHFFFGFSYRGTFLTHPPFVLRPFFLLPPVFSDFLPVPNAQHLFSVKAR